MTEIRVASSDADREQIFRLRYEVDVKEMGRPFVSTADNRAGLLSDPVDEVSRLLMATVDDELAGTLRITVGADGPIPKTLHEEYQLARFADLVPYERMIIFTRFIVRPNHRGSLVAVDLLRSIVSIGIEHELELAFCDCEPYLLGLYTALGFRSYCRAFNDENLDLMIPLVLVNDREYLERIGSPMLTWGLRELPPLTNLDAIVERLPTTPPARQLEVSSADWAAEFESMSAPGPDSRHIFAGLYRDEVERLVERGQVLELSPGDKLIRRGRVSRNVYVVLGGELEVRLGGRTVASHGNGEVVGEVAFLLRGKRTADVNAGQHGARVLSISEQSLHHLIESQSRAAAVFLLNLSRAEARRLADSQADDL